MLPPRFAPLACIAAVTFALLVDEILLSPIFHVLVGEGNAAAAISVALLGLSSAGIATYMVSRLRAPQDPERTIRSLLAWFGVTLVVSVFAIMNVPLNHMDLIFADDTRLSASTLRLMLFLAATAPFFVGGLAINSILRRHADRVSTVYFADLAGAAIGCIASPVLLSWLGAPRGILLAALPALFFATGGNTSRIPRLAAAGSLVLLAAGLVAPDLIGFRRLNTMGDVRNPVYQPFSLAPGDLDFEEWALDAWTVIRSPRIPQQWEDFEGWGLSPSYDGPVPELQLVNYNARFSTYVTAFDGDFEPLQQWLDSDLISLHHLVGRSYERVLVIGAGGGREVLGALSHGARDVVAVDVSTVVIDGLMKDELLDFSGGLYERPDVTAVADEGRSFTERSDGPFDLIEFSIVGGANLEKMDLVRVDDLFTVEAIQTYFDRLGRDGVFSYVMYSTRADLLEEVAARDFTISSPYVPALRTLGAVRQALGDAALGAAFADHVLVAALPGVIDPRFDLVHIVASKKPFSAAERDAFAERCRALGFRSYQPNTTGEANLYARLAESPSLAALDAALPFSVRPATDNRPFQFALGGAHLGRAWDRGELLPFLAANPVIAMAVPIAVLSVLLMLAPLLWSFAWSGSGAPAGAHGLVLLAFFGFIGFGYMAVEIAVLLKLQLYLGKPIYGLSVALFSFLLASSLGSFASGRVPAPALHRALYLAVGLVVLTGFGFTRLAPDLFAATVSAPIAVRMGLSVFAVLPVAFVMGTFFPLGIRLVRDVDDDLIPWVWAANGFASVLGIFGTRTAALFVGFESSLLLGLAAYFGVAACVLAIARLGSRHAGRAATQPG